MTSSASLHWFIQEIVFREPMIYGSMYCTYLETVSCIHPAWNQALIYDDDNDNYDVATQVYNILVDLVAKLDSNILP